MASVAQAQQDTQAALAAAIANGGLTGKALGPARQLLDRLERPTRVGVLGMPGSGKSSVVNLLAGAPIVPVGLAFCTVQVTFAEAEKATITLRDGSNLELEGPPEMDRIGAMTPVFVRLELNLPALRKISLLEIVTPNDRVDQIRAMKWAMKQTDIAIWCTGDYNAAEQALWVDTPDAIKDHAILLRTRADELGGNRDAMMAHLTREAGSDFAYFLPLSNTQAQAAKETPNGLDKAAFKASGATGVISTILRQIEKGRQHTVDQADVFLAKQAKAAAAQPAPEPAAETVVETPEVEEPPQAEKAPEKAPEAEVAPPEPTPEPIAAEEPADVPSEETGSDLRRVLQEAVTHLQTVGTELAALEDVDNRKVLATSAKTLRWLDGHLNGEADNAHPALERFRAMTQDADDLVQLLKIEGGDDSAVDAVSAMLQLKRGFQSELAA